LKPKLSEHQIQKQILDWLKAKGIFHWRNNTGAMKGSHKGKGWFMRFGAVGSPDIFVVHKGDIYGIEVKAPGKFESEEQRQWGMRLIMAGGYYIVAHSLEDILNFGADWKH